MREITLKDGDTWGTTSHGGLFRTRRDGTWHQLRGTGDTPVFRCYRNFSRWVHTVVREGDGERLARMVSHSGWGDR